MNPIVHAFVAEGRAPDWLTCPITRSLIRRAVRLPGAEVHHAYEESAVVDWLDERRCDPLTNMPLPPGPLQRDRGVQAAADALRRAAAAAAEGDDRAARVIQSAAASFLARRPPRTPQPLGAEDLGAVSASAFAGIAEISVGHLRGILGRAAADASAPNVAFARRRAEAARSPQARSDGAALTATLLDEGTAASVVRCLLRAARAGPLASLRPLSIRCAVAHDNIERLLTANDATGLRLIVDQGGLSLLSRVAEQLPAAVFAGGRFATRQPWSGGAYTGECNGLGEPHGRGVLVGADGRSEAGEWALGRGHGLMVHSDAAGRERAAGIKVEGRFTVAVVHREDGTLYAGETADTTPEGCGELRDAQQNCWRGAFAAGSLTSGSALFVDGRQMLWSAEAQSTASDAGHGCLMLPEAFVYAGGCSRDGKRQGRGVSLGADGGRDSGHWSGDALAGLALVQRHQTMWAALGTPGGTLLLARCPGHAAKGDVDSSAAFDEVATQLSEIQRPELWP